MACMPSPITSRVTPCRISDCERPSASSEICAWLSMLMNPGATAFPPASISRAARAPSSAPTAAIVLPLMATQPPKGLPPLPS